MKYLRVLIPAAVTLACWCPRAESQTISVVVDNHPVNFDGAAPVQQSGAVLVPLRSVFEALGATVEYNLDTKTVTARKGDSTVTLAVGSGTATVDGKKLTLNHPAVVLNGNTLVPLRFVAEAFGEDVEWIASTNTVQIITPEAHLSTLPTPDNGQSRFIGQLTGIFTNTSPEQITVRVNGQNTVVSLTPSTVVLVRSNDEPGVHADIHTLNIGDQVRVSLASDGSASSVEAVYGEVIGTVKTIQQQSDGTYLVSLNDGTTVDMESNSLLKMAGRTIQFGDIMAAERVRIRTDQHNKIGYSLSVLTGGKSEGGYDGVDSSELPSTGEPRPIPASSGLPLTNYSPSILTESPADGATIATTRPMIYALIEECAGHHVNPKTIRILIDGKDVTASAVVTSQFVTYQPSTSLGSGEHKVELSVTDSVGNNTDQQWRFVSGEQHQPLIFTSNVPGRVLALQPGEDIDLTLNAQPGGTAFATVSSLKVPLTEVRPGVYTGVLSASDGVVVQNAPVTAHYTAPDHTDSAVNLSQMITFNDGLPLPPSIKTPEEGQSIGNSVQISGLSAPGNKVLVRIDYSTRALGLIDIDGTAAQTEAVADSNGKWRTESIPITTPSLLSGQRNTDLTIDAVAVDAIGQHSPPASIKVLAQ